jgi:hypothetical protein
LALTDAGVPSVAIAAEMGISQRLVNQIQEHERIRREAETTVDPTTLSPSAQQRFESAVRQHQRRLDSEFERRVQREVNLRVHRLAYPRLVEIVGDAHQVLRAGRQGIFTRDQYNKVLRCVHPDLTPTIEEKNEAFRMLHEKKLLLLSLRDDLRVYTGLPTVEEMTRAG